MASSRIKQVDENIPRVAAEEVRVDQAGLGPAGAIAPIPSVDTPTNLQRLPPAATIAAVPSTSAPEPA